MITLWEYFCFLLWYVLGVVVIVIAVTVIGLNLGAQREMEDY